MPAWENVNGIEITPVRALKDNYCYVVRRDGSRRCLVVDASEAAPIARHLERNGLELGLVLTTHHHWDHVGGNVELASSFGAPVFCSAHDLSLGRVPGAERGLADGEALDFDGIRIETMS